MITLLPRHCSSLELCGPLSAIIYARHIPIIVLFINRLSKTALHYKTDKMMQSLLAFAFFLFLAVKADVVCPPSFAYAPCICVEISERPGTIFVDCWDKPLGDSGVIRVLDAFLTTPNISQVGWVRLFNTQLTRIPDQMKLFPRLFWTDISGNSIPSIESGAFNFTENLEKLDLLGVELTTIAPGAFGGLFFKVLLHHYKLFFK